MSHASFVPVSSKLSLPCGEQKRHNPIVSVLKIKYPCQNLTKPREKLMTKNVLNKLAFLGAVFVAAVGFPLIFASSASAQLPAPAVPANPTAPAPSAEVERVIVTGSNI